MDLPVNFEEKVRLPAAVGGAGYPSSISARDLMRNFVFAAVSAPEFTREGLTNGIKEVTAIGEGGHASREFFTEAFPENPAKGDMMYYDGTSWVRLPAPSGSVMHVLTHDGIIPAWVETFACAPTPP